VTLAAGARDGLERVDVGGAELACLTAGAADAPVVLCAHGFPDCARSFRAQTPALVAAGYRVVAPFLRGYAPSSTARDRRYDAAALAGDLLALADHFSPRAPIRLVGHDWGAIAAYAAAAHSPGRIAKLCTLAVPHMRGAQRFFSRAQLRRSWYIGLFQLRGIAERKLSAGDFALVDRLWRDWSPGYAAPAEELAAIKSAMRAPENLAAVLGYYRALFSRAGLARATRRLLLARTRVPSLYVHGVDDGCLGVELVDGSERGWDAPVSIVRLAGAGHFLHLEQPDEFNRLLLEFFA
jgi:pimeloyl-ACP methyl ester carboxylesterase